MDIEKKNISNLIISDGEIINGIFHEADATTGFNLKERILKSIASENKDDFVDLEETDKPFDISSTQSNTISNIDAIEYISTVKISDTSELVPEKNKSELKTYYKAGRKEKIETAEYIEDIETLPTDDTHDQTISKENISAINTPQNDEIIDLNQVQEADSVEDLSEEIDDIEYLSEKVKSGDVTTYPGAIDIKSIDPMTNTIDIDSEEASSAEQEEIEIFGVNKKEVFYNIDKQIYANRSQTTKSIRHLKLPTGAFVPTMVALITIFVIIISMPVLLLFFKANSQIRLEQNVHRDNSILARIAQQKEEEAKQERERIEEERRQLEFERSRMEATISDELEKQEREIEQRFQEQMRQLQTSGLSREEIEREQQRIKQLLENEINTARIENQRRIDEQNRLIADRDQQLRNAEQRLREALANREFEAAQITQQLQQALAQKDAERENVTRRLQEISEYNQRVKDFYTRTYQMISNAINDFKNNDREAAIEKLSALSRYYANNLAFVNSGEDLKMKMETDLFFVDYLTRLINESRLSSSRNTEVLRSVERLESLNNLYREAEDLYTRGNFNGASERYQRVLREIDSVSASYTRLKEIELNEQNRIGITLYNDALSEMTAQRYQNAITKLGELITRAPLSDYRSRAVTSLTELTSLISNENAIASQQEPARLLFQRAEVAERTGDLNGAIALYNELILKYPYSSQLRMALEKTGRLYGALREANFTNLDAQMRERFAANYRRFVEVKQTGDYRAAREIYYTALSENFNAYTNNTIMDFKKLEDDYITRLSTEASLRSESGLESQLAALRETLTREHRTELESRLSAQQKVYEDRLALMISEKDAEITRLQEALTRTEQQYNQLVASSGNVSQEQLTSLRTQLNTQIEEKDRLINSMKIEYERTLEAKNRELSDLKSSYDALVSAKTELDNRFRTMEQSLSSVEGGNAEAIQRLKDEHQRAIEEITRNAADYLKQEYEQKLTELNNIIAQKERESGIQSVQMTELYQRYNDLLVRYNSAVDQLRESATRYQDVDNHIRTLQTQYEEELRNKVAQMEADKERLKNEFDRQITMLRRQLLEVATVENNASNAQSSSSASVSSSAFMSSQLFARITGITGDTVTIQFISLEHTTMVNRNDIVKVFRMSGSGNNREELFIGTVQIGSTIDPNSIYARARVISTEPGQRISVNDILRN